MNGPEIFFIVRFFAVDHLRKYKAIVFFFFFKRTSAFSSLFLLYQLAIILHDVTRNNIE